MLPPLIYSYLYAKRYVIDERVVKYFVIIRLSVFNVDDQSIVLYRYSNTQVLENIDF